ncbi:hypothetical protein BCL76_11583 [Streptomyces sp. CG 926]|nr:hypothetical protein BCL76_11583 [Streptomyces sp. CG 926]
MAALGALTKAPETTERARGHLYGFHQLTGTADFQLDDAVRLLREADHQTQARQVEWEVFGRNGIPEHWAFQNVEAYNNSYYRPFAGIEQDIVAQPAGGRDHLHEARLKELRRTNGHPDHTW